MIKAFLSHSSAQKQFVRSLAKEIGFDHCILDENNFESGYPTINEIYRTLGESNIFILLLSNEALNSNWVKREIAKAKVLLSNGQLKRLHPFIIDKIVTHEDHRIESWLRDTYTILPFSNHILLARKINEMIREISWELNPILKIKSELYVGRNQLTDELESKIYSGQFSKRRTIIASGWDGVGRKKFLKHFVLEKQ